MGRAGKVLRLVRVMRILRVFKVSLVNVSSERRMKPRVIIRVCLACATFHRAAVPAEHPAAGLPGARPPDAPDGGHCDHHLQVQTVKLKAPELICFS